MVSNIFYFHHYLVKISNLTNIFLFKWVETINQFIYGFGGGGGSFRIFFSGNSRASFITKLTLTLAEPLSELRRSSYLFQHDNLSKQCLFQMLWDFFLFLFQKGGLNMFKCYFSTVFFFICFEWSTWMSREVRINGE